jgi:hypothetical protein
MRRAVFLDRDGVLNVDTHYLHRISDVIWVPGAKEAVSLLTRLDYQIFYRYQSKRDCPRVLYRIRCPDTAPMDVPANI